MDSTVVRKSEWRRDCVERDLRVRMHRATAFSERVSEHGRSSNFPAAASELAERSIFAPANACSSRSDSGCAGFARTHRSVWRLRCRWRDLPGVARGNAARLRRDAGNLFAFADGGGLRVEPRERRTLPRAISPTIADRH